MNEAETKEKELEEGELEEKEACDMLLQYERNFDPDVDLSHIGDKVQILLGHFRKDFEGGVQMENMGARYGVYGSFLSSYEQSPSDLSHARISQSHQNNSIPGYTYNFSNFNQHRYLSSGARIGGNCMSTAVYPVTRVPTVNHLSRDDAYFRSVWGNQEIAAKLMTTERSDARIGGDYMSTAVFPVTKVPTVNHLSRGDVCFPSFCGTGEIAGELMTTDRSDARIGGNGTSTAVFPATRVPTVNHLSRGDVCFPSVCGTGEIAAKLMPTDRSDNPNGQKSLEVPIKTGSTGNTPKRYEALNNRISLDSYPPLSDNIPAQSKKLSPETPETPDESPMSILENMTSFPAPEECLLSPLTECFLCLTESRGCTKLISVDSPLTMPRKRKTKDWEGSESYLPEARSPAKRKSSCESAASEVIKEGNDLKDKADRLKKFGSKIECTSLHFQAAVKFLHGAFLLEPCSNEIAKHREITDSMLMYREAAILCESAANEYKRCNQMTAAALAYKCMEVAYMRIVYSKVPHVNQDRHELQIDQVNTRPDESPLSSGSDIDNLHHQGMPDKSVASQLAACRVVDAGNRPIDRVLNFVQHVVMAMEASKKCEQALAGAKKGLEESKYATGISLVQRVTNFSFQNIDGLLCLVQPVIETISH